MKPSVNRSDSALSKVLSKREGKKQINIAWNPRIVFQLGLIAVMLLVFFAMNLTIEVSAPQPVTQGWILEEPPVKEYEILKDEPKVKVKVKSKAIAKVQPRVIQKVINVIPDATTDIPETNVSNTEVPKGASITTATTPEVPKSTTGINTMKTIEFVPVFPGCGDLDGNFAKQACMSEKIGAFIVKKFRADKFEGSEFTGKQRIYVQFTIDKYGVVTNVKANAAHESLKKEAIRVVTTLPEMIPGIQGNSPVPVRYRIPIVFQFE